MRTRLALGLALAGAALAAAGAAAPKHRPAWLAGAEQRTLARAFGGARPVRIEELWYPRKVAVVWTFDRVVVCGACSAPSNASLPRGRVIRMSFDRRTHRPGNALQFCEARGAQPPPTNCLRR
jgi:hypothetical protein